MDNRPIEALDVTGQSHGTQSKEVTETYTPDYTATAGLAGHLNRLRQQSQQPTESQQSQ